MNLDTISQKAEKPDSLDSSCSPQRIKVNKTVAQVYFLESPFDFSLNLHVPFHWWDIKGQLSSDILLFIFVFFIKVCYQISSKKKKCKVFLMNEMKKIMCSQRSNCSRQMWEVSTWRSLLKLSFPLYKCRHGWNCMQWLGLRHVTKENEHCRTKTKTKQKSNDRKKQQKKKPNRHRIA